MRVQIHQPVNSFLYLPTYIAQNLKLLEASHPDAPELEYGTPVATGGDVGAIERVLSLGAKPNEVNLAVCDPTSIAARKIKESAKELRLIGALITKPPFWGVDHHEYEQKRDRSIDQLKNGLAIKHLYYYTQSLATGYALGRRTKEAVVLARARPCAFGEEFGLLEQDVDSDERTSVAITADIIRVAQHCSAEERLRVVYRYFHDPDFQSFLTTGIFCHVSALRSEPKRRALIEVLAGMMSAVGVLRISEPIARQVCMAYHEDTSFYSRDSGGNMPRHLTADEVDWMAKEIHASGWYSEGLNFDEKTWLKTAHVTPAAADRSFLSDLRNIIFDQSLLPLASRACARRFGLVSESLQADSAPAPA